MEQSNWFYAHSNKSGPWNEHAPARMSRDCNRSTITPPVWDSNEAFRQYSSASYRGQTPLTMNNPNMQYTNLLPYGRNGVTIRQDFPFSNDGQTTSMKPWAGQTSLRIENPNMHYANLSPSGRYNEVTRKESSFSDDGQGMNSWVKQAPLGMSKVNMQDTNLLSARKDNGDIRQHSLTAEGANATLTKSQRKKQKKKLKKLTVATSAKSNHQNFKSERGNKNPCSDLSPSLPFVNQGTPKNIVKVKMAIVKDLYPSQKLSKDEADFIIKHMLEKLDVIPVGHPLPSISKTELDNGALILYCRDFATADWLESQFDGNKEVISGSVLKVGIWKYVNTNVVVSFWTRDIYTTYAKALLRRIQRLNPKLKSVENWKILNRYVDDETCRWVFEISSESAESIKQVDYKAFIGLDKVFIKVSNGPKMCKNQISRTCSFRPHILK